MKDGRKSYKLLAITAIFFSLVNIPLFAKAVVYPDWFTEEGLDELYPSEKYIREKGEGSTKQAAENDAVSYIARYFETEAKVSSVSEINAVQANGETDITEKTNIRNEISSNIKLFGVKFTEAFYLKKQKTYYVVAYIDKEDAWNRYESEVESERDSFISYYENAMGEENPIDKIKLLNDAIPSSDSVSAGNYTASSKYDFCLSTSDGNADKRVSNYVLCSFK